MKTLKRMCLVLMSLIFAGCGIAVDVHGPYEGQPDQKISISASVDGNDQDFSWGSPADCVVESPSSKNTFLTCSKEGVFTLSAKVSRILPFFGHGEDTSSTDVTVAYVPVEPPSPLPVSPRVNVFVFSPEVIDEGESAALVWDVSPANDVALAIDCLGGNVPASGSQGGFTTTTTCLLAAVNAAGNTTASATLTVNDVPVPPVPTATLSVTPGVITEGDTATLSWTTKFADSATISGIGSVAVNGSNTVSPSVTTTYVLTATGVGGTITVSVTLTVNPLPSPVNQVPTANAHGPYAGTAGIAISISCTGTDSDGTSASYLVAFGDGTSATTSFSSHVYAGAGVYTITCTVTDNGGLTGSNQTTATIASPPNQPPTANANGPYASDTATAVDFSSTGSSDPDGTISVYQWDFDYDGVSFTVDSALANPSHIYGVAKIYTAALRVTDNQGAVSPIATAVVSIAEACVEKTGLLIAGDGDP